MKSWALRSSKPIKTRHRLLNVLILKIILSAQFFILRVCALKNKGRENIAGSNIGSLI